MNTNADNDLHCNDLTQLSSREQLSALMDGALPADQARFLLRRLQHDDALAGCWERWRIAGEAMRGLAPARRLPADFASRVHAALHASPASQKQIARTPAWLRWSGGAAVAASLAVVALVARQPAPEASAQAPAQVAAVQPDAIPHAVPSPAPASGAPDAGAQQTLAAATAVAVAARPVRGNRRASMRATPARSEPAVLRAAQDQQVAAAEPQPPLTAPQPDIVTRPWPRSVLPQYANGGLTVGFGEHARGAVPYNPFQGRAAIRGLQPASDQSTQEQPADAGEPPQAAGRQADVQP